MVDIATLGLKIDSSQTVAATTALDKFAAAAKPAATNASALEKAAANAAIATTGINKAATAAAKGTDALTKGGGLARHELINLSRQAQDVVVSLQGGQGLSTVLLQQGSQIADVFVSSKGSVAGFASQIVSAIGPARLLAGGITLVAGAALYAVNSLKNSALAADDLSLAAGLSIIQLRGLQNALSLKGISGDDATKFIENFGRGVYQARINAGGLSEVFRANNTSAKGFGDYMSKAADMIKNAKDDQTRLQLLQEMGLPANMQFVRFMQQGGEAIRQAIADANNFNNTAEGKLVASARKFDDAWNSATTSVSNKMKTWALNAYEWLDTIIGKAGTAATALNRAMTGAPEDRPRVMIQQPAAAASAGTAVKTIAERQKDISDRQTYLSLLGQTATAEQAAEQVRLANDAAFLSSGVSVGKTRLKLLQDLAREQSLGITQIKASTDAANVDAATTGMAVGQATAYAAAQDRINEARRAGRTLKLEDIAAINREATALGQAAQNADNMRFAYENLVRGPMQTFQQQLSNGATFFDALKKSGVSALNALSSKLMDMATQNLWKSAFGGSTGGGGILSGISSLFGGGGGGAAATTGLDTLAAIHHTGHGPGDAPGPTRYVHPAHFNDAPRFHSGIGPGEKAAIIRNDESVLTPGQMKAVGGAGGSVTAPVYITIDATGADPAGLARVQQQLATLKAELPSRVVAAVTTARKQRQL